MDFNELFAANLRRLRGESGLTQIALAEKVGVTAKTIRDIEAARRNPSFEVMGKIARSLGVDMASLVATTKKEQGPIVRVLPSKLMQKLASIPDDVYEAIFQAGELSEEDWGFIKDVAGNARERNLSKKKMDIK